MCGCRVPIQLTKKSLQKCARKGDLYQSTNFSFCGNSWISSFNFLRDFQTDLWTNFWTDFIVNCSAGTAIALFNRTQNLGGNRTKYSTQNMIFLAKFRTFFKHFYSNKQNKRCERNSLCLLPHYLHYFHKQQLLRNSMWFFLLRSETCSTMCSIFY